MTPTTRVLRPWKRSLWLLHVDPRQYEMRRLHRGVLEGTSSTTMMVRWKLTRLSLMSCLQGWSISRMKWCSSATEVTDTRTLGNPKSSQNTLRNGQHGSEIKAVLKRSSDLKKSNCVDGGNVSVEVGAHCAEGVHPGRPTGTNRRTLTP